MQETSGTLRCRPSTYHQAHLRCDERRDQGALALPTGQVFPKPRTVSSGRCCRSLEIAFARSASSSSAAIVSAVEAVAAMLRNSAARARNWAGERSGQTRAAVRHG